MENAKFTIGELFNLEKGKITSISSYKSGKVPYVGCAYKNGGVLGYYSVPNEKISKGNCICFIGNGDGSAGLQMYKDEDFCSSSGNILGYADWLDDKTANYIIAILNKQQNILKTFSHSNGRNMKKLKEQEIYLPSSDDGVTPDYAYMREYIFMLEQERIAELEQYLMVTGLDDYELTEEDNQVLCRFNQSIQGTDQDSLQAEGTCWQDFTYENFFELLQVHDKRSKSELSADGYTPLLTSQSTNNGIVGKIKRPPEFRINEDNPFYVVFGDHTQTMNIVEQDFCVADNVKVLKPLYNNVRVMQYICCSWQKSIPTRGYARHWSIAKNTEIRLPSTSEGEPDYDYMERYIRAIEKLCIKNVVDYKDQVIAQTKRLVA